MGFWNKLGKVGKVAAEVGLGVATTTVPGVGLGVGIARQIVAHLQQPAVQAPEVIAYDLLMGLQVEITPERSIVLKEIIQEAQSKLQKKE